MGLALSTVEYFTALLRLSTEVNLLLTEDSAVLKINKVMRSLKRQRYNNSVRHLLSSWVATVYALHKTDDALLRYVIYTYLLYGFP